MQLQLERANNQGKDRSSHHPLCYMPRHDLLGEVPVPVTGRDSFSLLIQFQDIFSPQLPPDFNKNTWSTEVYQIMSMVTVSKSQQTRLPLN